MKPDQTDDADVVRAGASPDVRDRARDRLHTRQVADRDRRHVQVARVGRIPQSDSALHVAALTAPGDVPHRNASQSLKPWLNTRPGIDRLGGRTCPAPWRKISTGFVFGAGVPPSRTSLAGRHQRRLDHHRRPVRVHFLEQRRETGHVRAGHRRAAVQVEQLAAVSRRRHARQDVLCQGP